MEVVTNNSASSGLMGKLKDGAVSQLNTQKNRATDGIGSVAQAVRQGTQQLKDQQHDVIARYVEDAASRIDRFAHTLRDRDVNDLLSDAQRFARRNPALFIGSAFAIGLFSARFLKSSRPDGNHLSGGGNWRQRTGLDPDSTSGAGYNSGWGAGGYAPAAVGTTGSPQAGTGGTASPSGNAAGGTIGSAVTPGRAGRSGAPGSTGAADIGATTARRNPDMERR